MGITSKRFITVEKANTSDDLTNYLDLTFIMGSDNRLYIKLCDKRDNFDFHIVNFPFLSSNILSSPSYGVNISQLKDMQGAAHIVMTLDIAINFWLTDSYLRAMK